MGSEFHENGIITGVVGSFCLLCEEYVTKAALSDHIVNPVHKEKMASSAYVEKYKDDRIRKVKAGYYCEPCNTLIQTSSKVVIHIGNARHINNKTYHLIREVDAGLVVFEDILITKQAWNGQNVESCYVCNMDYSDEDDHAKESSHVLNVIQSKLELKKDKFVYRKVDETFINCLICNSLISLDTKESHTEDSDHVSNYTDCRENLKKFIHENERVVSETVEITKITTTNGTEITSTEINNNKIETNPAQIIDNDGKADTNVTEININKTTETNLAEIIDNKETEINAEEINDNGKTETATEAASNIPVPVKTKTDDIATENSDIETIVTPGEALNNVTKFARENHLKYKRNSTYCKLCDVKISSSFKRLKEHVAEAKHQEKAAASINAAQIANDNLAKVAMSDFVERETEVRNIFARDIVINDRFCISYESYHTISQHRDNARCQICEVSFDEDEVENHINTWQHVRGLQTASKLTASVFDTEFVREVRPKAYHCGYCNFIEASMSGLKNHLKSINHGAKKGNAFHRLRSLLADIEEERRRRMLSQYGLFGMLMGMRRF